MNIIHEPLFIETTFFLLSLLAAFILFKFLKNYAHIKTSYGSFGGAVAAFIVIFLLLNYSYKEMAKYSSEPNFKIPHGFNRFISKDYKIGFGYPNEISIAPYIVQTPILLVYAKIIGTHNYFSVSVVNEKFDIIQAFRKRSTSINEFDQLLKDIIPKAHVVSIKECSVSGLTGFMVEYDNGILSGFEKNYKSYIIYVPHPTYNFTYLISYQYPKDNPESAKVIFDKVMSTINFLE